MTPLDRSDEAGLVGHDDELSPVDTRIGSYMMMNAAKQMTSLRADPDLLSPTWSAVVLGGYMVVALGAATWLITRRDA